MGNVQDKWLKKRCFETIADGDVNMLERMLRKRPQFCNARKGKRNDGMSLLVLASFLDQPDKVKLLLQSGASPDKQCAYGVTALHMACLHGHTNVIRSLLQAGAHPETTDLFGQNSLHYAAMCVKINRSSVVQLVIDSGIDLNLKDHHFRTALHMACLVHHLDVAKQLLRSGTNVHMKDLLGREALCYIANEKIRDQLAHSGTYLNATRLYELKAFLVVLHHKTCQFNSGHLELCNVLKVDKTVDYRSVFNIEELRMKIMSYL